MTSAQVVDLLRAAAPFVLLGALLGAGYFAALRFSVERYLGGRSTGQAVALHVGRLLLAGAGFALIARAGAAPLLAALVGFMIARSLAIRAHGFRP